MMIFVSFGIFGSTVNIYSYIFIYISKMPIASENQFSHMEWGSDATQKYDV